MRNRLFRICIVAANDGLHFVSSYLIKRSDICRLRKIDPRFLRVLCRGGGGEESKGAFVHLAILISDYGVEIALVMCAKRNAARDTAKALSRPSQWWQKGASVRSVRIHR